MRDIALIEDKKRRSNGKLPLFQTVFRKYQAARCVPVKYFYLVMFCLLRKCNHVELPAGLKVGPGLFLGHPYCITINPDTVIGSHVNIHKGVTIGIENRGGERVSLLSVIMCGLESMPLLLEKLRLVTML